MNSSEIRQKYLDFLRSKGHKVIPSVSLVPENDPTTLLVSSGMQPLIPYLLGQPHPLGTRLVDTQTCIRAHGFSDDMEEVGDNRHLTFFEMLGNWSLGDYFKKEQLSWVFEFLTSELNLDPNRIYVTVFTGLEEFDIPKDIESVEIWKDLFKQKGIDAKDVYLDTEENAAKLGMQGGRIFYYGVKKNWWSRCGPPSNMTAGEPGGPDSEMFYEFPEIEHDPKFGENCHPNCDCGRYLEIGNSVFIQYQKLADGSFKELPQKNVDFGGGYERLVAITNNISDVFETDLFWPMIEVLQNKTGMTFESNHKVNFRTIADHIKASTFLVAQGVLPSNKQQGYILRRMLRRAAVKLHSINPDVNFSETFVDLVKVVIQIYSNVDSELGFGLDMKRDFERISDVVRTEMYKFEKTLDKGLKELHKVDIENIDEVFAFYLFETYGFPFELTQELVRQKGKSLNKEIYNKEVLKHREESKSASEDMFKGGLGGNTDIHKRYHTATHLLQQALRDILGDSVAQKGSNITSERLRFDFSFERKLTVDELSQVEQLVNQKVSDSVPVNYVDMPKIDAEKTGALHLFGEKYGDAVRIYYIGSSLDTAWSKEFCGGPHVSNTSEIGNIKIVKEEAVSSGTRRIKAILV